LIHNLELACTSYSNFQYARLTQAAVIYRVFSGLLLQSISHLLKRWHNH